jgi:flagellar basal body-associated protein FliL
MATPDSTESPAAAPRAGMMPMLAIGLVALGAGAGVGRFVVAPRLAPAAGVETPANDGHGGEEAATKHVVKIDGVIVNPAGSRGQHHLIVSVAVEVASVEDHAALTEAETALRDRIGSLLEQQTVEVLSAPGARDRLRAELAALVAPYVHGPQAEVFLPQYILQ